MTSRATGWKTKNKAEEARKEKLDFDKETGRLVLSNPSPVEKCPDRPVLDAMVAEGFFYELPHDRVTELITLRNIQHILVVLCKTLKRPMPCSLRY